jgi:hypothetical protein
MSPPSTSSCAFSSRTYVYLAQLRSVAEGALPAHDSWIAALPSADVALTPKQDIDISSSA